MKTHVDVLGPVEERRYRLATFAFGAVTFGSNVQFTHWPLLTALQLTVTTPVDGHPVEGHVAGGSPSPLSGKGLISSLYDSPPKTKLTPSLQLPLDVTTFASG